ncbi:DMT family transporter [Demetria terragena]|uniref:DMT family transporter n=1 Tax=Demetria terragena TaxID=63959 RepID=UPI000363983A|nr:DMT family transporter [Demetria terragena]
MSSAALSLVLTAALLHALWNTAAKRVTGDSIAFVWLYATASALLWVPLSVALEWGQASFLSWSFIGAAALTGALHNAYGLSLQTGYRKADLGVVYPVARGTGPLLTMAVALLVLGEKIQWPNAVGGVVVIAGVAVVATATNRTKTSGRSAYAGLVWGLLTGTAIAGYTLWDNHAVTALGLAPVAYFAAGAAAQSITLLPWMRGRWPAARELVTQRRREIGIVAVLSPLAYVLVLIAMQTTPVALVAPARESSIVVGTLLGWWMFGEGRLARKLLGSCVVLAGIALIAL